MSMRAFWTSEALRAHTGGEWVQAPSRGIEPGGVRIDAREIEAGGVFVALPGERADGRKFLAQASERGAAVAIVTREGLDAFELPDGLGVLAVEDAAAALGELARAYRETFEGTRVVGVTGSNGKTTTVRLIEAVLRGGGLRGSRSQKSYNNHLGLPVTLLNTMPGDDYVICEMGTSSPGEIGWLAELARPDVAVIVSIGRAHLEKLGSIEGVAREKSAIVRGMGEGGTGIVPSGVGVLEAALSGIEGRLVRVGTGDDADVRIERVGSDDAGTAFSIVTPDGTWDVHVPLPGVHNASNGAMALAVGRACGVDFGPAIAGLAGAANESMRLTRVEVELPGGAAVVLNDAYNANPDSVRAGLSVLAGCEPADGGRRVAVLGDLLEMGEHEAAGHAEIAGLVRTMLEEGTLGAGVLIGERFAGAGESGEGLTVLADSGDGVMERVAGLVGPGDVVLVKGSRGMRLERVVDALRGVCR